MSEENQRFESSDSVQDWLNHPYTAKLQTLLERTVEMYEEKWSHGGFLADEFDATAQANIYASGMCSGINKILHTMKNVDQEQVPERDE